MKDSYLNIKTLDWKQVRVIRICIVGIIEEEMIEIIKSFDMSMIRDEYIYWEGYFPEYPNISIHCYQQNESGNIPSQQLTSYLLNKGYDYYFYVGTAGAIKSNLYDVIIANQIICLEKGANTVEGRKYDGKAIEISEKVKNLINAFICQYNIKNQVDFEITMAPVYSGENVEKNPEADEIKEAVAFARHLAAIDMESFGVFSALRFNESFIKKEETPIIVIRGISDKADDQKNGVYGDGLRPDERKKRAMENAVEVLKEFIRLLNN